MKIRFEMLKNNINQKSLTNNEEKASTKKLEGKKSRRKSKLAATKNLIYIDVESKKMAKVKF